jgi:catechol 2,3-dioxygenase-like lactoylglutathione lyase family enzyme
MNIRSIYHININCTDLDRSFPFYQMLGFRPIIGPAKGPGGVIDEKVLRLGTGTGSRGVIMQLGDDPHCSHIDLIEWQEPRTEGRPYERLDRTGIARACFYSKNIWKDYETLRAKGVQFYSEPQILAYENGQSAVVCFEDPDGTVLELVQFQKTASPPPASPGPDPEGKLHLVSVYHININCTDLDRALEFYKMLGFRVDVDMSGPPRPAGAAAATIGTEVLRVPDAKGSRAMILGIGEDPHCSHIDLIQWGDGKSGGRPYERLNHCGIARACFYSRSIWADYEELRSRGVNIYSEPEIMKYPNGAGAAVVCFEDPDGSVLELVQYQKQAIKPPKPWA